ncbi:pentatricopeptide repeat-containing protein [Pyrus ussuriensis x Pyrus communis]|uniref:Pentatricopeptide repeat-containing protein n=1 Tax=Pyrus ussuriensis x Pyrus communis TaxID=2448454 RepID=A0A5N5HBH5_9ROSA|nr:pentatricopeptide repeat-containing protein [Pyrus ussuriensis x Pyrus communis]
MKKLLEFDFSAAVDGAVKDEAAKIEATEDEEPQGEIGKAGSRGARSAQLGAIMTDQGLPGVMEYVGIIRSYNDRSRAKLCSVRRIGPLGP